VLSSIAVGVIKPEAVALGWTFKKETVGTSGVIGPKGLTGVIKVVLLPTVGVCPPAGKITGACVAIGMGVLVGPLGVLDAAGKIVTGGNVAVTGNKLMLVVGDAPSCGCAGTNVSERTVGVLAVWSACRKQPANSSIKITKKLRFHLIRMSANLLTRCIFRAFHFNSTAYT